MPKNLKIAFFIMLILIAIGTTGFHLIEGWDSLQAFYTTIMTLTTVGYGDFAPKTKAGMLFTAVLVIFGVGTMLYSVGLVAQIMVEGTLLQFMGRGRMEKTIEKMHNHFIICGCGRIGMLIAGELILAGASLNFVAFARFLSPEPVTGQVVTLFIMGLAAAEAAIVLSLVVAVYRNFRSVETEKINDLKG